MTKALTYVEIDIPPFIEQATLGDFIIRADFTAANQSLTDDQVIGTQATGVQDGKLIASSALTASSATVAINSNKLKLADVTNASNYKAAIRASSGVSEPSSGDSGPLPLDRRLAVHFICEMVSGGGGSIGVCAPAYQLAIPPVVGLAVFSNSLYLSWYDPSHGGKYDAETGFTGIAANTQIESILVTGGYDRSGVPWDGAADSDDYPCGCFLFYWDGADWVLIQIGQGNMGAVPPGPPPVASLTPYLGFGAYMNTGSGAQFSVDHIAVHDADYEAAIVPTFYGATPAAAASFTGLANQWIRFGVTTRPSSGNMDVDIRRASSTEKWTVRVNSAGDISLIETTGGVPTTRGTSAAAVTNGTSVLVMMDAARIIIWRGNSGSLIDYASASSNQTATGVAVNSLGTGGVIGFIVGHPRRGYFAAETLPVPFSQTTFPDASNPATGTFTNQLTVEGDSMPDSDDLRRAGLGNYLGTMLGGSWRVSQLSLGGSTIANLTAPGRINAVNATFNAGNARNELVLWIGTNDGFAGTTAATAASAAQAYLTTLMATWGTDITWLAMLDRQQVAGAWSPNMSAFKTAYNSAMESFCNANGLRYFDPTMNGQMVDSTDATYFRTDPVGVHINYFASGIVARQIFAVIGRDPPVPASTETFRFTTDTAYLPNDIDAIPSIREVRITPAIVSLGGDLGQRASVDASFKDHRHIFASEAFDAGTFWGKFRARYGLKLRGYPLRVIQGTLGQTLESMETRHFIIESTDGPSTGGEYRIIAKDILKFADGDRSQAPTLSGGFLVAGITNVATTLTLSPAGSGNMYYDAAGYVAIGGKEIVAYTRAGDVLTITRAQYNTTAVAHAAGDRVQACIEYLAEDVADIIYDLFVTHAGVDPDFITLANWQTETGTYLNTLYSALIAEPTAVNQLISELIEQASLVIWWDDINQQIRLQVLRTISTVADIYDEGNMLAGTLEVKEQPDKRISQVYTYFAKINPLANDDQIDNYGSSVFSINETAELEYGSASIKKIFSRWIPAGGRSVAESVNDILLARFLTPPRRISFDVMRYAGNTPALGLGYQIEGWPFQDQAGAPDMVPAQIVRLNPRADIFEIEAEEVFAGAEAPSSPNEHLILIDANSLNVNLRTMHDSIFVEAVSGVVVNCTILSGIIVGSSSIAAPAFDVGSWAAGVTINVVVLGRIEGAGGAGGAGALGGVNAGQAGGTALYTRYAINLTDNAGGIWGGGGGGGSGGTGHGLPGTGGGGAGQLPGNAATTTTGGTFTTGAGDTGRGGFGGDPGLPGLAGTSGAFSGPGAGGAAGAAIDGVSFVTTTGTGSPDIRDRRGGQIN